MLGFDEVGDALLARPPEVRNVDAATWHLLTELERAGRHRQEFLAAWANGTAFLRAADGLRGRRPAVVEWKGGQRAPGDEVVPADLRVDHVWFVSCKYLSKILINASPAHLFERNLQGGQGVRGGDWYAEVAPAALQGLYEQVRDELGPGAGLPPHVSDLLPEHRDVLRRALAGRWSEAAGDAYRSLATEVARQSVDRWRAALGTKQERLRMLWRLLRIGSAPYFVLGASPAGSLRLRVATPWDWRAAFDLRRFDVWADDAGQPLVRWRAVAADRAGGVDHTVEGHVEIRWSHGRFAQAPEAKVYLDTPHRLVPGYFPLT